MRNTAYIALGSNLGDRLANLRQALDRIDELPGTRVDRARGVASIHETPAFDVPDEQPNYLNTVVRVFTDFDPHRLMSELLAIEVSLGRVRSHARAARKIDLDLLLFNDLVLNSPSLVLPHPRMHVRLFVLDPLVEIAGDVVHPVMGETVRELQAKAFSSQARLKPAVQE